MPVLLPHEGRPDSRPNDGRELSRAEQFPSRVTLMKEIISSKGPLTLVWDEYFDQNSWESKLLSHGMVPVDDIDPQYQTWTIGTDVSLHQMSAWGGYKPLNGLEIISPVLRNTPECWEEVLDMVSILRNNFRLTVGKSCGFHVHCPLLGKMDPNVLRVFLLFLGKGDDYDFWVNRIERMMNLPLDAQQLAPRPIDNNEILPPLDEGYIDALREELCTREMKLPSDLAKLLSEKASFFDP
ncbi:hypothetical protein FCIRC_9723 [Fusarium circinatum]|uniref:Amidoligase enzyme n=1 Tax=Fusarium circinatum TaxID=48490 RepID=A0A8H5TDT2_FUSCI|nr:hypothetical protein FCIRC_9723 [Fusarium circinatum]